MDYDKLIKAIQEKIEKSDFMSDEKYFWQKKLVQVKREQWEEAYGKLKYEIVTGEKKN